MGIILKIKNKKLSEIWDLTFLGDAIPSSGRGGSVEEGLEGGGVGESLHPPGESGRARAGRNGTSSSSSFTSVLIKLSKMLEVFEVFEILVAGRSLSVSASVLLFLFPLLLLPSRHLLTPAAPASLITTTTTSQNLPLFEIRLSSSEIS